jgi:hypothetical protein
MPVSSKLTIAEFPRIVPPPRLYYGALDCIARSTIYLVDHPQLKQWLICHPEDLAVLQAQMPEVELIPLKEYRP